MGETTANRDSVESTRAGVAEAARQLVTGAWARASLQNTPGQRRAWTWPALEGSSSWGWSDQLRFGARSDTDTDTWTQPGTCLDWRKGMKYPHNYLMGSTVPSAFRATDQRLRGLRAPKDMASRWLSGHGTGQLWAPCSQCEALPKLASLSWGPPYEATGRGTKGPKRSDGLHRDIHDVPSAGPGKQGLEAAPSPTCRGHLESGPGTGPRDKSVARALNKGSQGGQPCGHHCRHTSKTGAPGSGGTLRQARAPRARAPSKGWTARGVLTPFHTRGPRPSDRSRSQLGQRVGGTQCKNTTAGPNTCRRLHTVISLLLIPVEASCPILQMRKPRVAEVITCLKDIQLVKETPALEPW